MKKRIFTLALALLLLVSLAVPVWAADITTEGAPGEQSTTVTYGVAEKFTVTIPADFTLSTEETSYTLSAAGVLIPDGEQLTVTMKSANFDSTDKYRVAYEGSYIKYTVKNGDTELLLNEQTVLTLLAGTTSGSTTLKFSTTAENIASATKAGSHIDTLTFTVAVGAAA